MLTIDGVEDTVEGWVATAQESGSDITSVDVIRRFVDLEHQAKDAVFKPVPRHGCSEIDKTDLSDLLAAWHRRNQ